MPAAKAKTMTGEEAAGVAKGWTPEPGDNLTGTVVHLEMVTGGQYDDYPMITIQTANGYTNLHAFHQVLRQGLTRLAPKKGDQVSVTYHGKQDTKKVDKDGKARQFHNYTVRDPSKPVEAFSWGDESDADF
jgi:hypothetical protein